MTYRLGDVSRRGFVAGGLTAAAFGASSRPALADWRPVRPIRMIAPFPPGGTTDILARLMGQLLSESLGQPVAVENRAGAAGTIGMEAISRSAPDGYTIGIMSSAHAAAPSLIQRLPYDAVNGIQPLALITRVGLVLVTRPNGPYASVADFIAAARRQPGRLTLASSGAGNANHLAIEQLNSMAGIEVVHVPYRGGGPAMNDVMGGQVDGMFNPVPPVVPLVTGGRLRGIGIASSRRARALPDVPTMAEAGVARFENYEWFGIAGPAGLPADVVARYEREMRAILERPDTIARLAEQGIEVAYEGPAGFRRFFEEQVAQIRELVRIRNITVDG